MTDKLSADGLRRRYKDMGTGGDGEQSYAEVVVAAEAGASANGAGTARNGSIAVAGQAQPLAAANSARRWLWVQNISPYGLWLNAQGGTAAADTEGSCYLAPLGWMRVTTTSAVSIVGAVAGQKFTALEV